MDNPFVVGARVAVERGTGGWGKNWDYLEDFILKVHKSGRFTLRSDPSQQWRPDGGICWRKSWSAISTGDYRSQQRLIIWDETTDAIINEQNAKEARRQKRAKLAGRLERLPEDELTDEMLSAIERALNPPCDAIGSDGVPNW